LRAVLATTLLLPLCGLVGMGVAAAVRHLAGTLGAVVGLLLLLPFLFNVDHRWSAMIYYALPTPAYQRLLDDDPDPFGMLAYDSSVTGSWLAWAGWATAAVVVALVVSVRRDP
jgi:hypothetical protein